MSKNCFREGEIVAYRKNNNYYRIKIVKIHYDDIEPYYTILFNGKEIQTVGTRLIKIRL